MAAGGEKGGREGAGALIGCISWSQHGTKPTGQSLMSSYFNSVASESGTKLVDSKLGNSERQGFTGPDQT